MSLCKVCTLADWESAEFLSTLGQLNLSFGRQYKHRKHWEFAKGISGLKRVGCLNPNALALGVGAGHEHPICYLANYVKRCFDFAFSFSSIEHFGGHQAATRSIREIARVLRPGGIAVITTELILNDIAHPDFFRPNDLTQASIKPSELKLIEEIDFSIPPSLVDEAQGLGTDTSNRHPHIVLKLGPAVFTSVIMFQRK